MRKRKYRTSEDIFKEGLPDFTNELQHDYIEMICYSRTEVRRDRKRNKKEDRQEEACLCLMRGCAWDDPEAL